MKLRPSDFILVPTCSGAPSSMASFMAILKTAKVAPPYNFAFIGDHGPLLSNMTLECNILHQIENSYCDAKNTSSSRLTELLAKHRNPFLKQLFQKIEFPGLMAKQACPMQRKLAGICQGLLGEKSILLLNNPESWLGEEEREILRQALLHERKLGTTVLLASDQPDFWKDMANFELTRDEQHQFQLKPVINQNILNFPYGTQDPSTEKETEESQVIAS